MLWPLVILPIALVNQILAPHAVWLVLVIALTGLYGIGLLWVRVQAPKVVALRERTGTLLVAGDTLRQDFELRNHSRLPVLWAEFIDESDLPGSTPGRVVACGAYTFYRWNTQVVCQRRGVFRLGPHRLHFGDPFGLFGVEVASPQSDMLVIYPRVVHLPDFELPHGNAGESRQRRRPLRGTLPSASVNEYRPGDSLRHIHWRSTARRNRLMVKELEIEPSGDVWVVLDLNRSAQRGEGARSTLEYSIIVAASVAAKLLSEGERRAVGLLTVSGQIVSGQTGSGQADSGQLALREQAGEDGAEDVEPSGGGEAGWRESGSEQRAVLAPPQPGQAQLWRILSALAPVEATDVTLADLLHNSREVLGGRRTLIVVTSQIDIDLASSSYAHRVAEAEGDGYGLPDGPRDGRPDGVSAADSPEADASGADAALRRRNWLSELVHLRASGLDSSVLLIAEGDGENDGADRSGAEALGALLAAEDIASQTLYADIPLQAALTFRRTRRVVRSTPTGGVVAYDVEEDVG